AGAAGDQEGIFRRRDPVRRAADRDRDGRGRREKEEGLRARGFFLGEGACGSGRDAGDARGFLRHGGKRGRRAVRAKKGGSAARDHEPEFRRNTAARSARAGRRRAHRNGTQEQAVELNFSQVMREANAAEAERQQEMRARAKEAIAPELFALTAGDSEDPRYRRITSPAVIRDLNPLMQLRMQQVCFYLSVTTPFGKRIVRVMVDYVVGEGFKAVAEDPDVQQLIDKFWTDPANKMDENEQLLAERFVLGELCIPVAVNPVDGFVKLGYIDPQEIEYVEFATMQTQLSDEITMPAAVRLRQRIGEAEGRRLKIISRDDDPQSPTFGRLTGDCFYFAINKAKAASRG